MSLTRDLLGGGADLPPTSTEPPHNLTWSKRCKPRPRPPAPPEHSRLEPSVGGWDPKLVLEVHCHRPKASRNQVSSIVARVVVQCLFAGLHTYVYMLQCCQKLWFVLTIGIFQAKVCLISVCKWRMFAFQRILYISVQVLGFEHRKCRQLWCCIHDVHAFVLLDWCICVIIISLLLHMRTFGTGSTISNVQ